MGLKPGYKRTEVGVIPEDWDVLPMSQLLTFQNGVNADKAAYGSGTPFINVLEVITNTYLKQSCIPGRVSLSKSVAEVYSTHRGDILFNRTSETQEEVGLASVYIGDETVLFGGFVIRGRSTSDKLVTGFAGYGLRGVSVRKQFIACGQGAIRANVGQSDMRKILIPLPSQIEQNNIAEALSDADALVESLEQLLAKKRHIKQGAMQDLLTGKNRLPGFSGQWVTKHLGESAYLKARIGWQGLTTAEYMDSGKHYLVTGTEFSNGYITWDNCHFVSQYRYDQDRYIQLRVFDVLVTKDGTIGKVAFVPDLPLSATLNSGVFVIRPIDGSFHPEFFYYLLCSTAFTRFLAQLSAGSTINHLYQKDFVSFTFLTPPTIGEQVAIAAVFTDMDVEIATLETKLTKARQLKTGMMQELLTGRIRLIEWER